MVELKRLDALSEHPIDLAINLGIADWSDFMKKGEQRIRMVTVCGLLLRERLKASLPEHLKIPDVVHPIISGTHLIACDSYRRQPLYEPLFNSALLELSVDLTSSRRQALEHEFVRSDNILSVSARALIDLAAISIEHGSWHS